MIRKILLLLMLGVGLEWYSLAAYAQTQQSIAQAIVVNGQQVQGVTVVQNGAVQNYTCPAPQQYVAADQSSSGWACFDETTGTWLLHALPPQSANAYDQSQAYYPDTSSQYTYGGYPYAYSYSPYGYYPYSYWGGPGFAFGFGFGRGYGGYRGYYGGAPSIRGPVGAPFAHGTFGGHVGGFGHPGGGFSHGGGSVGHGMGGGGGHGGGGRR